MLVSLMMDVHNASAQQAWTGLSAKSALAYRWTMKNEVQYRADIDPHQVQNFFTETELGYMLHRKLEVRSAYRHRFLPSDALSRNRFSASLIWEPLSKDSKSELATRVLLQRDVRALKSDKDRVRFLTEFAFDMGAGKPFFSLESFHEANRSLLLRKLRSTVGVKGDVSDRFQMAIFYRRDDDMIRGEDPGETIYIFGLAGTLKLRMKTKLISR